MKITIEISRDAAMELLRQLESELRPKFPPLSVKEKNTRVELLAMQAIDYPWPERGVFKARVLNKFRPPWGYVGMTVEALCREKRTAVIMYRNWGAKTVAYIMGALGEKGLKLGMTNEEIDTYRGS